MGWRDLARKRKIKRQYLARPAKFFMCPLPSRPPPPRDLIPHSPLDLASLSDLAALRRVLRASTREPRLPCVRIRRAIPGGGTLSSSAPLPTAARPYPAEAPLPMAARPYPAAARPSRQRRALLSSGVASFPAAAHLPGSRTTTPSDPLSPLASKSYITSVRAPVH